MSTYLLQGLTFDVLQPLRAPGYRNLSLDGSRPSLQGEGTLDSSLVSFSRLGAKICFGSFRPSYVASSRARRKQKAILREAMYRPVSGGRLSLSVQRCSIRSILYVLGSRVDAGTKDVSFPVQLQRPFLWSSCISEISLLVFSPAWIRAVEPEYPV